MICFGGSPARCYHYEQWACGVVRCDWRGFALVGPLRADGGW